MFKLHLTVDRYADIRKQNNPTEFKSTLEAAAQPVLFHYLRITTLIKIIQSEIRYTVYAIPFCQLLDSTDNSDREYPILGQICSQSVNKLQQSTTWT